ncbi:MAG TPA: DUF4340 domain-containing protein [Methylophaga sp.]|nr:DUF4340 domain-containing protein [Methylophaga sp.]
MKSSYLRNITLLLLIIGLYWFNNQSSTPVNNSERLTAINSDDIQLITITRSNISEISIEKTSSGWQITHPIKARANNTRIALLLGLLNTYSYAQQADDRSNSMLAQFGLAPAKVSLKLNDYMFQFGDRETISKHRYVLHDDIIHLIDDQVTALLNANVISFIDNRLILSSNIINKLELPILSADMTLSDATVTIENNDGHWQSDSQLKQESAVDLTILVDAWQQAYALQVQPINIDTQQTVIPSYHVKVWYQNQDMPAELELQLTDHALFIIDCSQQLKYQFPRALVLQLLPMTIGAKL